MSSLHIVHDEPLKYFSMVTKLVYYTSKFGLNDDGRQSKQQSSARNRLSSTLDLTDKLTEGRRFRLAPIWPEWNEAEINNESWDSGIIKKKETTTGKSRADAKTNISTMSQTFEDPDGKIELPPSMKAEQWKRPIDFLPSDKPPVIVDPDRGIQNFDLITSNEHLHHSEIMRNIISQITALWDIYRIDRKNGNTSLENINQSNTIERTWRPWEHIYALTKVSKQPFLTPYNPAGKYVVRLFFLGTWRKIIIDDSIPFDSQNRCLLPQTTLSYELWPMLLTKALFKIISLDFNPSYHSSEYTETSVIHLLTGWIPELIPLKYTYAEQMWKFLRYDHSDKLGFENEIHLPSAAGPVSLYKWPGSKIDRTGETTVMIENDQIERPEENLTKKFDDKKRKKSIGFLNPPVSKDSTIIKSTNIKDNRTSLNSPSTKDMKKTGGITRGGLTEDLTVISDDQTACEAPKMIIFATMSHSQSAHLSSITETADRSERLRRYNLNETFSTSVLLTTIRDIPLEAPLIPQPTESTPAWKLIRPRKAKVLPHAEPIISHQTKPERWIEIASPYINYPSTTVLDIKPTIRPLSIERPVTARPFRFKRHSTVPNPSSITEVDEDEDVENRKLKSQFTGELARSLTSISLPTTRKELIGIDTQEKSDTSSRSAASKWKRAMSIDKTKIHRKSDTASIKSKGSENEQLILLTNQTTVGNSHEQQSSQSSGLNSSKKSAIFPKIWMNFDDFCACFTSVIVFHNPRGYQYNQKYSEIKFTPYQPPVVIPVTKEKKKEVNLPVIQPIPNLQDDKSSLYLFVDSTRETFEKNIRLIISLTCLPRWYDAVLHETVLSNDKSTRGAHVSAEKISTDLNLTKTIISQKEVNPQTGSLIAEIYSWKSLSIGQPILRLHTTATKAALLTLPPGRHVLKLTNACSFAYNLQILSDTNDFMLGDEDQLLNKIISIPEDADFLIRAEELFSVLEDTIDNFHLINQQGNKLHEFFRFYSQHVPASSNLILQTCLNAFNQALYSTLRTMMNALGMTVNVETQFAWRCFTNDLLTPDILGAYEVKRSSAVSASRNSARIEGRSSANTSASKRSAAGRDKSSEDRTKQPSTSHSTTVSDVQEETKSDLLVRELSIDEIDAVTNIQKFARGFLQRRIDLARKSGTEKNLFIQQVLQSTMTLLKIDSTKSALLLFKNLISIKPQLIQWFPFRTDDWNMVTYQDYHGFYQEQPANTCFVLFREIFYVTEECFIAAKFLSHLSNSLLRVINNDTYEEMPLIFNRLAPGIFAKNKHGYTFFAEGISLDQSIPNGRFRLRLITSYAHLPELYVDQITSSFYIRELMDYYLPNKEEIICRYRVLVAEDTNQTGRNFHLASIHFSTSKSDVYMRLTIFDYDQEIVRVEGKGSLVLPAILFMRTASNIPQSQPPSRPTSKTTGMRRKSIGSARRVSVGELVATSKERAGDRRLRSQTSSPSVDGDEKSHKYFIQVTVLRKSWPLTLTQWQFVEQLKEQEKNELKSMTSQLLLTKNERSNNNSSSGKRTGQTSPNLSSNTGKGRGSLSKGSGISAGRLNTRKESIGKTTFDITKPHWILRVISDADKADELTIKKDNERNEELINMKKAWETLEAGRAEKAMRSRQKFLDSLQLTPEINDATIALADSHADTDTSSTVIPSLIEQQQQVMKQTTIRKKSSPLARKESLKLILPQLQIDEPLLDEPPVSARAKISLPPLDITPFIKRKKLSSNQSIVSDSLFEQEDFERRQDHFREYLKYLNDIRQSREDDQNHRSNEKIRQLEEYIDLQARIDQIRRVVNEPREAFRQRFLEIERQRLQIFAAEQQRLLEEEKVKAAAAEMIKAVTKKTAVGKKKTK